MVKWLYKILFLIITFSFFVSATEIDLGECHNTFFDDCDTYVKTEQLSLQHTVAVQPQDDSYALLDYIMGCCTACGNKIQTAIFSQHDYYNHFPQKLFLRNSVWRI